MFNSSHNSPLIKIKGEIGSPLVQTFLELFQERIEQAHLSMETANTEDLYRLQGRCNELREIQKQLTEHRQSKFKGKDGAYR